MHLSVIVIALGTRTHAFNNNDCSNQCPGASLQCEPELRSELVWIDWSDCVDLPNQREEKSQRLETLHIQILILNCEYRKCSEPITDEVYVE